MPLLILRDHNLQPNTVQTVHAILYQRLDANFSSFNESGNIPTPLLTRVLTYPFPIVL